MHPVERLRYVARATGYPQSTVVAEAARWQCTFTNTLHPGTVTIVKHLDGAPSGTFPFTSSLPGSASFDLSPTASSDATRSFSVPAGTYSVAEGAHAPYSLAASCTGGSTPTVIVVQPDATIARTQLGCRCSGSGDLLGVRRARCPGRGFPVRPGRSASDSGRS